MDSSFLVPHSSCFILGVFPASLLRRDAGLTIIGRKGIKRFIHGRSERFRQATTHEAYHEYDPPSTGGCPPARPIYSVPRASGAKHAKDRPREGENHLEENRDRQSFPGRGGRRGGFEQGRQNGHFCRGCLVRGPGLED